MAPMDAVQSATSRAAEMLDMKGEIEASSFDAHAFPEGDTVFDFHRSGLGLGIKPRSVFVLHAVHYDVVIVSGPLPRADRRVLAWLQEFLFDRVQREILIALNSHGGVALRDDLAAPRCLCHIAILRNEYKSLYQDTVK